MVKKVIAAWVRQPAVRTDIEVEFPVFSKDDLNADHGDSIVYRRWNADGSIDVVWEKQRGSEFSYQLEREEGIHGISALDDTNYILGRGMYACSSGEFYAACQRAKDFLCKIMEVS